MLYISIFVEFIKKVNNFYKTWPNIPKSEFAVMNSSYDDSYCCLYVYKVNKTYWNSKWSYRVAFNGFTGVIPYVDYQYIHTNIMWQILLVMMQILYLSIISSFLSTHEYLYTIPLVPIQLLCVYYIPCERASLTRGRELYFTLYLHSGLRPSVLEKLLLIIERYRICIITNNICHMMLVWIYW